VKVIRILVIFGLLVVVAMQLRLCLRPTMVGKPAAELFAARWFNSEPLTMQNLRGRLVLLDFWAVW